MKALPFIEALKGEMNNRDLEYETFQQILKKIWELREFYSQPFDIEMLFNHIDEPKDKNIEPGLTMEWQKTEDKVLFKGLVYRKVRQRNGVDCVFENSKGNTVIEWYDNKTMWILDGYSKVGRGESLRQPRILDDFCNILKEYSIKLHWKQSIVEKYFNRKKEIK